MDKDEFAAFLAGAMMACALILLLELTRPRKLSAGIPAPPLMHVVGGCYLCETEKRELEDHGHTHVPPKRAAAAAAKAK